MPINDINFKNSDLFEFNEVEQKNENDFTEEKPVILKTKQDQSLEEFIEESLKNKNIQELKIKTEEEEWIKNGFPSFEKIMELKFHYKNITLVEIGDKLEEYTFKNPTKMYIIKQLPQANYQNFIQTVGAISANLIKFSQMSIRECVLFPELDEEDVLTISIGEGDILTNEINKFSRFASTKTITRI